MAMAAGLPPASPRLRSVLSEHFSLPIRCAPNAPVTLDAAATAMPVGAFGVDTQAVQRSCQAAWHVWAKGLALLKGHAPSAAPPVPLPPSEAMVVDAPPPSRVGGARALRGASRAGSGGWLASGLASPPVGALGALLAGHPLCVCSKATRKARLVCTLSS